MNLGRIFRGDCVNVAPPTDPRCDDPAFALANPTICPAKPRLVVKPGFGLTCLLGSVQFKAFLVTSGVEVDVSVDTIWSVSSNSVVIIGAGSGNATGVGAGDAIVTATYQGYTANAELTVMGTSGDCCNVRHVGMMALVDTSRSMSQAYGESYNTRLDFAKAAATRFISEVNGAKDSVGLITFNSSGNLTPASLTSDVDSVVAEIPGIVQTQQLTSFYSALSEAITDLDAGGVDLKVIVLFSDGEDTSTGAAAGYPNGSNPIQLLQTFKDAGGVVICVGARASGSGFARLSIFSTGGFFVNSYPGVTDAALDYLSGLKGYVCAGNCTPAGDDVVPKGQLDYSNFINWDVTGGHVDLIGPGLFDLLPGNGLYVDLAGSTPAYYGLMTTKTSFALTAGKSYRLSVDMAGNQRYDGATYTAKLQVYYLVGTTQVPLLQQDIVINDYVQDFQNYAFSFTAPVDCDAYISIQETTIPTPASPPPFFPAFGLLLGKVTFDNTTDLTNLLTDNFDGENMTYVPPACGAYSYGTLSGYSYNCYGEGCLDAPPVGQIPDPTALPDIEQGFTPPTVYNSTRQACTSCPSEFINVSNASLVPEMTSNTAPSGVVSADSEAATHDAWYAFQSGSGFWVAVAGVPHYLQYQFASAQVVRDYAITAYSGLYPKTFTLEGSNDGAAWTTINSQSNINFAPGAFPNTQTIRFTTGNTTAYLYYRLNITDVGPSIPGLTSVAIKKLELFATLDTQVCKSASAQSTVSQADADSKAYAAALALAQAALNCVPVFQSTEQFKADCPLGSFGNSVTRSASYTSYVSQADADTNASALAQAAAEAALDCSGSNNTQKITIPDNTFANPFPSVKFVSEATGVITNVQAILTGITHSYPQDVRIMLRHPDGTTCLLMGWCGGSNGISNVNLTFDDSGAALPGSTIASGTYKPTQLGLSNSSPMLSPAPTSPYGTTLSVFNGKDANGGWSLWVEDNKFLDSGQIASGFDLVITTA